MTKNCPSNKEKVIPRIKLFFFANCLFNRTTNRVYQANLKQLKYVKNKKIISI